MAVVRPRARDGRGRDASLSYRIPYMCVSSSRNAGNQRRRRALNLARCQAQPVGRRELSAAAEAGIRRLWEVWTDQS